MELNIRKCAYLCDYPMGTHSSFCVDAPFIFLDFAGAKAEHKLSIDTYKNDNRVHAQTYHKLKNKDGIEVTLSDYEYKMYLITFDSMVSRLEFA